MEKSETKISVNCKNLSTPEVNAVNGTLMSRIRNLIESDKSLENAASHLVQWVTFLGEGGGGENQTKQPQNSSKKVSESHMQSWQPYFLFRLLTLLSPHAWWHALCLLAHYCGGACHWDGSPVGIWTVKVLYEPLPRRAENDLHQERINIALVTATRFITKFYFKIRCLSNDEDLSCEHYPHRGEHPVYETRAYLRRPPFKHRSLSALVI